MALSININVNNSDMSIKKKNNLINEDIKGIEIDLNF